MTRFRRSDVCNLRLSHRISSIGYPATGHLMVSSSPATAVTLGKSRIYGGPKKKAELICLIWSVQILFYKYCVVF